MEKKKSGASVWQLDKEAHRSTGHLGLVVGGEGCRFMFLLDTGANRSFVTEECAYHMGLHVERRPEPKPSGVLVESEVIGITRCQMELFGVEDEWELSVMRGNDLFAQVGGSVAVGGILGNDVLSRTGVAIWPKWCIAVRGLEGLLLSSQG